MNNRADLALQPAPTPEARAEAQEWALRALTTLENMDTSKVNAKSDVLGTCETTRVAVLFNLGSLAEVRPFCHVICVSVYISRMLTRDVAETDGWGFKGRQGLFSQKS